jgi:uncharacterized membrane protein (UPF0127 family)
VKAESKPIVNLTRGRRVCERAVIADQPLRRMRGLLGRRSLPTGEGLLLQPAPSVHSAFMRFPIDVVFLDRNLQVVKVVESMLPWRTAGARHARAALELAAGEASARGIQVGDRLGVVVAGSPDFDVTNGTSAPSAVADGRERRVGGNQPLKVTPRAADPLHVLLVAEDRRFRAVTTVLLTRRGCTVTLAECVSDLPRVAKRAGADVVVIDAGSSMREAAREAAKIKLAGAGVGVVCVSDKPEESVSAMPVLPKWGSFEALYRAVESARPDHDSRSSDGGS